MVTAPRHHPFTSHQLGENIGAAVRAMKNFGLEDLRLIKPRDGWPNEKARHMAAGAGDLLEKVRLFDSAAEALGDLQLVFATTARERGVAKPVVTPAGGGAAASCGGGTGEHAAACCSAANAPGPRQ